ncbi:putative ubiquitin-conjugating enzyme E2, ubiquitin-conjugating enzyme/RWD [Helianthus anomalus]
MDLLRAVIIGAKGNPYHDGLFVFDVYIPSMYPLVLPLVRYHSFGFAINPHLFECGELRIDLSRLFGQFSKTL